ncbi:pyrimidine 5'-nucleotidase [Salinarimonas ramus]|uniref:Pyrimidine 5'-nucleotidase n=1 Tax=Salinarimonas ramus TaxID=690164 RepID=A0A917V1F3_9HYPH|nr:pyrimidine 5'-nucleotidase [Salinarimonas ramus]GGK18996.1 pyrimidine 5'-nucleotidase [Salinarimonas ramus]
MKHIATPAPAATGRHHFVAPDARGFAHVETWIFDLDNTLYSHEAKVWPQIDERITLYVANMFGIDGMSARALQKHYYLKYGTTLRALMTEHAIDPYAFMDFVHDIDHRHIELNPVLGAAIERLPGRKLILTNGSRRHAEAVAGKLGILDHFEDVFDLADADFTPKPNREAYDIFLKRHAVDPARSAMFEDIAKNLRAPHDLGMTTTLVVPRTPDPYRESFEQEAVAEPHVDYITDDLAGFLVERTPA